MTWLSDPRTRRQRSFTGGCIGAVLAWKGIFYRVFSEYPEGEGTLLCRSNDVGQRTDGYRT
jgi:hypothetical protein